MIAILLAAALAAPHPALPTPEDPVRLLLHEPTGRACPLSACDNDLCGTLLALIEGATTSIDFAIYGLRGQPAILEALRAAQARGVRVRGVVDRTVDGQNYYADTDALVAALGTVRDDLAADLQEATRQRPYDPSKNTCWMPLGPEFPGPRQCVGYDLGDRCVVAAQAAEEELTFQGDIMHDKFFVVDDTFVWTGSTNTSDSCSGGYNANLVLVVGSATVASWYTAEFEQLYAGRFHGEKRSRQPLALSSTAADHVAGRFLRIDGYFSPQDRPLTKVVAKRIAQAKERIDVAIFFLTHKAVAGELIAAHRRGVAVRVLADASGATNGYTKIELLRAAGVPVKVEDWGGKMHMKAAAIDGETVIAGSMNWTSAGEWGNDENTLVLHSRPHAEQFHAWFDATWAKVPDRWLQDRPDPESRASGTACTDGVDNDHDHLVDAQDPGCGPKPPPLAPLPPHRVVPKAEGHGLVKGDLGDDQRKRAWLPNEEGYDAVVIDPARGEAFFCSLEDAKAAGFWPAR